MTLPSATGGSSNLIAEFTDWTGAQVEVHGLRDGFAVFVADRLVQKNMSGTDMARYFCHVLQSKNALIKSISAVSETAPNDLLRQLVLDCQNDLATYIVPDSGISEHDVVNTLLGRLDGPQSRAALAPVSATRENEGFYEKAWKDFCSLQCGSVKLIAEEALRYRRLKDASGRTWDKLAGANLTGQLDKAIDGLGDDE